MADEAEEEAAPGASGRSEDWIRRRNHVALNPEQMKTAGQLGTFAGVLRHTGRISGTAYETPLATKPIDDGFVIDLVYGPRTEWLKNLLASGTATIVYGGTTYEVDHPEVPALAAELPGPSG